MDGDARRGELRGSGEEVKVMTAALHESVDEAGRRGLDAAVKREGAADQRELHRSSRQLLDQGKEGPPRGVEAVALDAALTGPCPQRLRLGRIVDQPPHGRGQGGHVARIDDEPAAVEDLGNHGHACRYHRSAQRHGIEELGRHLAQGVGRIALGHGDHVRRREEGGNLLERHPGQELRPRTEVKDPLTRRAAGARPDHREDHVGPIERGHRGGEILEALVAARRAEKHDEPLGTHPQPPAPFARIGAAGLPGIRVPDVGDEGAAEPLLEKAGGDGHSVGEPGEALAEPGPGKAGGIAEIHRPAQGAPEARSQVKAHLPVVDVEQERAPTEDALQVAHARASQLGLRRHDQITVGPARHVGHDAKKPGRRRLSTAA
mgnify:CR=1 FL=1